MRKNTITLTIREVPNAEHIKTQLLKVFDSIGADTEINLYLPFSKVTEITITPCVAFSHNIDYVPTFADIEYYLVSCDLPYIGTDSLDVLCERIANLDTLYDESQDEKAQLQAYYDEHRNDDNRDWFDFYSDWHKDVYGYRPHIF